MRQTLIFLCLLFISFNAGAQNWPWAQEATCSGYMYHGGSYGMATKTDANNNTYVVIDNAGDSICIGNNKFYKTGPFEHHQIVLVKYNSSGTLQWARASENGSMLTIGGAYCDLTIDESGNAYVMGAFDSDSIRFGSHLLIKPAVVGNGYCCYFIVKYDPNGNIIWAVQGNSYIYSPRSIAVDKFQHVYLGGVFNDSAVYIGPTLLTNFDHDGNTDLFLTKYDASGTMLWARSYGSVGENDLEKVVCYNDKVYIAGFFDPPTMTLGSTVLTYVEYKPIITNKLHDMFVTQLDSSGYPLWAKSSKGDADAVTMAVNLEGEVFVGGICRDTMVIFNTDTFHSAYLPRNSYLVKYSDAGDVLWSKIFGPVNLPSNASVGISAIATDFCENVWVSGTAGNGISHIGGVVLNGEGTVSVPASNLNPSFFAKFTSAGVLLDSGAFASGRQTYLDLDKDGNMSMTGTNCVDPFDLGGNTLHLYSGANNNFFVGQYVPPVTCIPTAASSQSHAPDVRLFPNPATSTITIQYSGTIQQGITLAIFDITGRQINSYQLANSTTIISVQNYLPGLYQCRITDAAHNVTTRKLVIMK